MSGRHPALNPSLNHQVLNVHDPEKRRVSYRPNSYLVEDFATLNSAADSMKLPACFFEFISYLLREDSVSSCLSPEPRFCNCPRQT